jgi:apolipoprotein N-acyltransferase
MDSNPDRNPRWAAPLAIALTAAAWWFAAGLQPIWWMAWLAPLPLLAWSIRARARWAALGTFAAFALGGLTLWEYVRDVIKLPIGACLQIVLEPALLMVPAVLLFRALQRRGRACAAMLSLPLAATGLSWVAAALSPHGTYGHIAYSQMDALPVIQIAAVAGVWGIGLLLWLFPAMLAVLTAPFATGQSRKYAALVGSGVIASALGYGAWRLHDRDAAEPHVRIGLVNVGLARGSEVDLETANGRRLLDAYLAQMDRLAARGARVVVAPEASLLVRSHAIAPLQALADRRGVRVLIGVEDRSVPQLKRNAALVFEPRTASPTVYYKRRFIPGFEDRYTAGTTRTMLPGDPRIGVAICKDLDFTDIGPAHARRDARLLLVPAWDFGVDGWMHARIAMLRGVEGGFAMARVARNGALTLSDDRGRVLAEASSANRDAPTTLLAELPLRTTRTPYARWGDAPGWLSLLAAAALAASLGFGRLPRHRASPQIGRG